MACTSSRCCVVARRKRRAWLPGTNGWACKCRARDGVSANSMRWRLPGAAALRWRHGGRGPGRCCNCLWTCRPSRTAGLPRRIRSACPRPTRWRWGAGWGEAPPCRMACTIPRCRLWPWCVDRDRCMGRLGYISSAVATTRHHPQSNPGDFMAYETIAVRVEADQVGVITLDRPKQLNALNDLLMNELGAALKAWDADEKIGCMIITGSEKAFAAGADIGAMAKYSFADAYKGDYITRNWETIRAIRKPVIAAVSGFALGGGCELAMMCDFIIAADNARFGQPEIKLGVIPGAGGTQRLPRAVGKSKAMDMALTGRMIDAAEAERIGLVSRVVAYGQLMDEALGAALGIAGLSRIAVMAAKESVNRAFEGTLSDGLMFERRLFHALFATHDQKEGMDAFVNKRPAHFTHQ